MTHSTNSHKLIDDLPIDQAFCSPPLVLAALAALAALLIMDRTHHPFLVLKLLVSEPAGSPGTHSNQYNQWALLELGLRL